MHASGLARVALKTGRGGSARFLLWEEAERQYVLRWSELSLAATGDSEADAASNTPLFTAVIEETSASYPRSGCGCTAAGRRAPPGEPPLY